ncbi:MAG: acyltransferase family protein, partial [Flavisolibacter sp.]
LCDLYCCRISLIKNEKIGFLIGILCLAGFIFIPTIHNLPGYIAKLTCLFVLVHSILANARMKKIFSVNGLVLIGGMCYSIYLLHLAIVSTLGRLLQSLWSGFGDTSYFLLLEVGFAIVVLFVSSIFYLLVEKPFMRPIGLGGPAKSNRVHQPE